jgi:hypothetical protein
MVAAIWMVIAAADILGNTLIIGPLFAVLVPIEPVAAVHDDALLVDQVGVVIMADPAVAGLRPVEPVHLPVAHVELRPEPEMRHAVAAVQLGNMAEARAAIMGGEHPPMLAGADMWR